MSEHSWLVFQLLPNSRAPAATDEYLVVKSSLRSPLLLPQRPHTLPFQRGSNITETLVFLSQIMVRPLKNFRIK